MDTKKSQRKSQSQKQCASVAILGGLLGLLSPLGGPLGGLLGGFRDLLSGLRSLVYLALSHGRKDLVGSIFLSLVSLHPSA
jgi:hypothetical protein